MNVRRVRLRQVNGFVLLLLAVALFAGFNTVDWERPTRAFLWVWTSVLVLLGVVVVLGLADLRMTWKLRQRRGKGAR
jgi:hypothetical protein